MADNPTKYFLDKQIVNFDIIHHECCGDKLENSYKRYKTVKHEELKNYPPPKMKLYLASVETLNVTIYGSKGTSCWSIFLKNLIFNFSFF